MTVRVEKGGYGVSWDSEIDLSENELWTQGIGVATEKTLGYFSELRVEHY